MTPGLFDTVALPAQGPRSELAVAVGKLLFGEGLWLWRKRQRAQGRGEGCRPTLSGGALLEPCGRGAHGRPGTGRALGLREVGAFGSGGAGSPKEVPGEPAGGGGAGGGLLSQECRVRNWEFALAGPRRNTPDSVFDLLKNPFPKDHCRGILRRPARLLPCCAVAWRMDQQFSSFQEGPTSAVRQRCFYMVESRWGTRLSPAFASWVQEVGGLRKCPCFAKQLLLSKRLYVHASLKHFLADIHRANLLQSTRLSDFMDKKRQKQNTH